MVPNRNKKVNEFRSVDPILVLGKEVHPVESTVIMYLLEV